MPAALSVREIAERWSISEDATWRLIKNGTLPSFRPGVRNLRVAMRFIEGYEEGQPYKPGNPDPWIRDEGGNAIRMWEAGAKAKAMAKAKSDHDATPAKDTKAKNTKGLSIRAA